MANTFVNIHLHIVFAVKCRDAMLNDDWRDELFRYIGGIIRNDGFVPVKVGGYRDHVHLLVGCGKQIDVAGLVKDIKLATNKWIQPRIKKHFAWQDGYGCFSISHTHLDALGRYIDRQAIHHATVSLQDEYRRLLALNGGDADNPYALLNEPQ